MPVNANAANPMLSILQSEKISYILFTEQYVPVGEREKKSANKQSHCILSSKEDMKVEKWKYVPATVLFGYKGLHELFRQ